MEPHDPHCRWPHLMVKTVGFPDGDVEFYGCDCALIAKARADERMKVGTEANAVVRQKDERIADLLEDLESARADERERIAAADEREAAKYARSHDEGDREWASALRYAARIARNGGRDGA